MGTVLGAPRAREQRRVPASQNGPALPRATAKPQKDMASEWSQICLDWLVWACLSTLKAKLRPPALFWVTQRNIEVTWVGAHGYDIPCLRVPQSPPEPPRAPAPPAM